nr:NB-ARC domains-containing protein [Tanacetum cinerariifolium]
MDFLDEDQSLELFCFYAFRGKASSREFEEVSQIVVKYVQSHPLALKVLGQFLYDKTVGQWVSELEKLKVTLTEVVEVLVLSLEKFSQKVHIDANDFAHMRKLRILKIYQEKEVSEDKLELKGHNVIFSGNLYYLSNELSFFHWHGFPFKYLPSYFYPENILAIDLSYSNIKPFWTKPKVESKVIDSVGVAWRHSQALRLCEPWQVMTFLRRDLKRHKI